MKIFKLMAIALVAMFGFISCNKDCGHEFIEYDYNEALIGTWTYLEGEQAEAMVINPDGSFEVTGVMKGGSLYEEKGTIKVVNNKVSLVFEGDKDVFEGRLELVVGKSLSIVLNEEYDIRLTYDYCEKDLSDDIVGMWVCNDTPNAQKNDIAIISYFKNGTSIFTGMIPNAESYMVTANSSYKVVGDLLFQKNAEENSTLYLAKRLVYTPNGTTFGDILTQKSYVNVENKRVETSMTYLRIKQHLDLTGKTYDYKSTYVTNAKGKDEDFTIMGNTFNIDKIKAYDFDKMFGGDLFCVELNANSFKYKLRLDNGQDTGFDTPMTIDGNKVTLDMNAINPALRKVEMYMFQDANDTQVHTYMHTDAFINYFANMEVYTLILEGKINPTDTAAIEKVFADMEARIESINVSFVMKARK